MLLNFNNKLTNKQSLCVKKKRVSVFCIFCFISGNDIKFQADRKMFVCCFFAAQMYKWIKFDLNSMLRVKIVQIMFYTFSENFHIKVVKSEIF